jgi:hypothetical protein
VSPQNKQRPTWRNACQGKERKKRSRVTKKEGSFRPLCHSGGNAVTEESLFYITMGLLRHYIPRNDRESRCEATERIL